MQLGDGLCFFASDARLYLPPALEAAAEGPRAILALDKLAVPSAIYVQLLAGAVLMLGSITSVAVLLNSFFTSEHVCCILVSSVANGSAAQRLLESLRQLRTMARFMVNAAIEGHFFSFVIVAAAARLARFCDVQLHREGGRATASAAGATLLAIPIYFIGVARWYVGLMNFGSTAVALAVLGVVKARRRNVTGVLATALLLILCSRALLLGAGAYLPPYARAFLAFDVTETARFFTSAGTDAHQFRENFDRAPAATQLQARPAATQLQARPAAPSATVETDTTRTSVADRLRVDSLHC